MVERFLEYIKGNNLWRHGQTWVVAFSGGADSTALLHLCVEAGIPVAAAHVHHGLRGEEADADAAFCRSVAQSLKIQYYEMRLSPGTLSHGGEGIQAQARNLRYRYLEGLILEHGFDAVATAHHLHDQMETMLLRMFRGTGTFGMRGIMPRAGDRVHPLLWATPQQIRAYLHERNLSFREDSTNLTNDYTRNYVRHEVLPPVLDRFPDAAHRMVDLARYTEASRAQLKFWQDGWLERWGCTHPDGVCSVETDALLEAFPTPERLWFLIGHTGITQDALGLLLHSIQQKKVSGQLFPGKGWDVGLSKGNMWWGPQVVYPEQPLQLDVGSEVAWGPYRIGIMKTGLVHANWVWSLPLPSEWNAHDLRVEAWRPGDRLITPGFPHRRKVADVLQALHMAPFRKANYPVIRRGNEVVAIPGVCASWTSPSGNSSDGSTIYLYFAFVELKQQEHHA